MHWHGRILRYILGVIVFSVLEGQALVLQTFKTNSDFWLLNTGDSASSGPNTSSQPSLPTFAAPGAFALGPRKELAKKSYVEGLDDGIIIDGVLERDEATMLVDLAETCGFNDYDLPGNTQGALCFALPPKECEALFSRCSHALPQHLPLCKSKSDEFGSLLGLNGRCRIYRYRGNGKETFRPHKDDSFPSGGLVNYDPEGANRGKRQAYCAWDSREDGSYSLLTFLLYLSDNFEGGETVFFDSNPNMKNEGKIIASVKPVSGSVLVFRQTGCLGEGQIPWPEAPVHEGSPVTSGGPKYVLRSDVIYQPGKKIDHS
mmetsp:Transcript_17122/g.25020  ORF Transcript_17122/g.25020 Transcript_17122/m.25020 type:complete len:316 (-) Transcript_17122:50-997(-)|eukprot:CAMPEP_0113945420 /NCGR_PEP_ID=MMETSP1339-20121228/45630_1 /TAXON_ID=94617 /ORGANISM="Fibrocapsa japonica" /LENGTH=315 /DNA_ID=CAMNT_0000950995 /DNA_START=86 /DNA_END=1033 /DNA_ORIENTATION=- /assembly_acc=CAM_ASM_000762